MATAFATKLASLAEAEYDNYGGHHETTSRMATRIRKYWGDLGLGFPGVSTPWSAVFVSFFVKSAGATSSEFRFAPRHSEFVFQAIKNGKAETGVFRGRPIVSYAPKIGDIIQNNRNGNHFDFAHAAANHAYESHSAVVVEEGSDGSGRYVRTFGGNEADNVGDRVVRLKSNGLIKQPLADPTRFICVIETLK